MRPKIALLILALPCLLQVLAADPVLWPVEATASFTGGIYGTWDFGFTTGPADLQLTQITIDLSPVDLIFDTAPGGHGSLASLAIGGYQGTAGLPVILPGTGLDGGQLLTFQFDNFTVGQTFHFTGDVDNQDPTLTLLKDCSGLRPAAKLVCNLQNAGITAQNDALLLAASIVTAREFSGALVTLEFGGPGFYTADFTGAFSPDGGLRIFGSSGSIGGDVQATPEPATCIPLAAGLLMLVCLWRRRRENQPLLREPVRLDTK